MATSLYKFQVALKTCTEHPNEELSCFSKPCKSFICSTCARTSHHGHKWNIISLVAKKRRREIPIVYRKIKNDDMRGCREKLRVVDENISDIEKASEEDVKKLEERRKTMVDAINQIIEDQKRKRTEIMEKGSKKLREDRSQLRTKIEYLDKMTTSLDSNIDAYTDFDVIEMEIEMLNALSELEAYNVVRFDTEVTYVPGEINRAAIEEMIGRIEETMKATSVNDESVSIMEVKTFKDFNKSITTIAPISSNQALIREFKNCTIKLLSSQSTDTNSVTLPPHDDFISLSNDDFIVTDFNNQVIRRVTSAGKVSDIVSTKPLHPTYISKTQTDLLVSLRDGGDPYKLQPSSRRLVQRMTLTGKVLKTYEFREDGVTRLFIYPYKTAENGNSDICVVNRTSGATGELIVLHEDGRVRPIYRGPKYFKFDPTGVACDYKSRIIVSDWTNKCVHLLSLEGTLLRYLLSDMSKSPNVLALYQGSLWIGFMGGTVKVYKYI